MLILHCTETWSQIHNSGRPIAYVVTLFILHFLRFGHSMPMARLVPSYGVHRNGWAKYALLGIDLIKPYSTIGPSIREEDVAGPWTWAGPAILGCVRNLRCVLPRVRVIGSYGKMYGNDYRTGYYKGRFTARLWVHLYPRYFRVRNHSLTASTSTQAQLLTSRIIVQ